MSHKPRLRRYPFPKPRVVMRKPSDRALAGLSSARRHQAVKRSWNHETEVLRWMSRCGMREIHRHLQRDGLPPRRRDLADHLEQIAWKYGAAFIDFPKPGDPGNKHQVSGSRIEGLASKAAKFAFVKFDWDMYERAAANGRKSRRGPTYQPADLIPFEGLSKRDQARAMGCSEATVARLRRALRAQSESGSEV